MNWFSQLTGIPEHSPDQVRSQLELVDGILYSQANGQSWYCGQFSAPSLSELRTALEPALNQYGSSQRLRASEQVADVTALHTDPANAGALFQVASQFNLLEMVSPRVTPEQGVGLYSHDATQGPACAIACGAGTIWRNYFMPLGGQAGQSAELQFDALHELGQALGNQGQLWEMRNGYALASITGLEHINQWLAQASPQERDNLGGQLRIGLQADTQVCLPGCTHRVNQIYCSALPVAYSAHSSELWEPFARLILDAAYEATFFVAMQQLQAGGSNTLYLTLLGGGAFGNRSDWIMDSLRKALVKFAAVALDVRIVSHHLPNPAVQRLLSELGHT